MPKVRRTALQIAEERRQLRVTRHRPKHFPLACPEPVLVHAEFTDDGEKNCVRVTTITGLQLGNAGWREPDARTKLRLIQTVVFSDGFYTIIRALSPPWMEYSIKIWLSQMS
nr:MAG TPA: hypothetical protein [Caudoviricetes sp.]